jgi:hypothetical protein
MLKNLLILERSSDVLTFEKDASGQYVLEGIFGEMGVKNKNGRVYDESEYLPQVEALSAKIKQSKLMGELDHPQNFDISLKNVSHVIEDITYDKESRQVKGRIRLLNTDAGRQAKALVDDGIPLHISSRAAGVVEANGAVKIKKLFTYDLVADPGFENAQLNRVNESYGFESDSNISIFEVDMPIPGVDARFVDDKYSKTNENSAQDTMEGVIKQEDFNKYSSHIAEQLNTMKAELESLKAIKEAAGENSQVVEYVEKLRTKMNEMFSYMNEMSKGVNGVIEEVNGVVEHNNHIVENVKDLKGYLDHVAEQSDFGLQYMEENAKKTNHIIEHNNYLAGHVDSIAQFGDHLTEGLNQLASYSEYLKGNIETVGQFGDYTAENVKRIKSSLASINEDDAAKEIEDKVMAMGEPTEHSPEEGDAVVGEVKKETPVEESFDNTKYKSELTGKLDILIESAQKQTADLQGDLHFLRFLSPSDKNKFYALNENVQLKVISKAKTNSYVSEQDVQGIIESVINPVDNTPLYLKNLPGEYRENWDKASQSKKNQLIAESRGYSLNSALQIENFWSTRDFREKSMQIEKLDESSNATEEVTSYGVTNDYLTWFGKELASKFQK